MDLNEFDELMGLNAKRSPEGRAYYGLVNEIEMIGYRASVNLWPCEICGVEFTTPERADECALEHPADEYAMWPDCMRPNPCHCAECERDRWR